ncbi:MAG: zinc ribbon domain-containing protein [Erysipelotrichia bacterium]|nr:zinc ribbon domain-containing protein [Erysipelotrichia bacterium]
MFSYCPRCETGKFNSSGICSHCGYSLRTACPECAYPNIPDARFCGSCGCGLNWPVRLQDFLNRKLNYLQKFKIKKFATGLAFGTLLTFFAFGTMGMQTTDNVVHTQSHDRVQQIKFHSEFAFNFDKELAIFCQNRDLKQNISHRDFNAILDLLIKHLRPIAEQQNKKRKPGASSNVYAQMLHNFSHSDNVTRGSSAMTLFHFLSDFLELNYRDFSQETSYNDIPRFHFMSAPAAALKSLNIKLAREENTFGIKDAVSLEQICTAAKNIVAIAEKRAEQS